MKSFLVIAIFLTLIQPLIAQAYPDFISYGYRSCLNCHFNGHGNGPLNDYGRALFATEIASRFFYNAKITEDELTDQSGFLGKTQIPWWIRPGIKARGLYLQTNPTTSNAVTRFIPMQADASIVMSTSETNNLIMAATAGVAPTPARLKNSSETKPPNIIPREYYIRWLAKKNLYLYFGFLDKVFGIRHADHTAFSRTKTNLSMNDQTHGIVTQYTQNKYELSTHLYAGNLAQDSDLRRIGLSLHGEYAPIEKWEIGGSALTEQNDYLAKLIVSGHTRYGYDENGDSIVFEAGLIQDKNRQQNSSTTGSYSYLQTLASITRGYSALFGFETYSKDIQSAESQSFNWRLGLLAFPAPRLEFRFELIDSRTLTPAEANKDQWALQSQIHLSL